jgi:magnesium transporter
MIERFGFEGGRVVPVQDKAAILLFTAPNEEERQALVGEYGIDQHDLASALDPDELGRMEQDGGYTVLILKTSS